MSNSLNNFIVGNDLKQDVINAQEARGSRLEAMAPSMAVELGLDPSISARQSFNMTAAEYRALTQADSALANGKDTQELFHTTQLGWSRWLKAQSGRRFNGGYFSALADAAAFDEGADNGMSPQFTAGAVDADATNVITQFQTADHSRYEAATFGSGLFLNDNPQAAEIVRKALTDKLDQKLEIVAVDHIAANVAATGTLASFDANNVLDFAMGNNGPVKFCSTDAESVREVKKAGVDYGMNIEAHLVGGTAGSAFMFVGDAVQLHALNGFNFLKNKYTYAAEDLVEFKAEAIVAPFVANPNAIVRYGA